MRNNPGKKYLVDFGSASPLECDSPIEQTMLSNIIRSSIRRHSLVVGVQYNLGPYYYDIAIWLNKLKNPDQIYPDILIECDGRDYHWTQKQRENDQRKNALARKHGIILLRFTGSDIHSRPSLCVDAILEAIDKYYPQAPR